MTSLKELEVDGRKLDEELLASCLSPYIHLDRSACDIRPKETWEGLQSKQKILTYMLARKAMKALSYPIEEEGVGPLQITRSTGLKPGTVNPVVRKLRQDGFLEQDVRGLYRVPNHAIARVKAILVPPSTEER